MAQLKLGSLRDFETSDISAHLIQRGQLNELAQECEKEYLVHTVPYGAITVDDNNDLYRDCSKHILYHFDTWEKAQAKYLALAKEYGANLKIQEWNIADWKV